MRQETCCLETGSGEESESEEQILPRTKHLRRTILNGDKGKEISERQSEEEVQKGKKIKREIGRRHEKTMVGVEEKFYAPSD